MKWKCLAADYSNNKEFKSYEVTDVVANWDISIYVS